MNYWFCVSYISLLLYLGVVAVREFRLLMKKIKSAGGLLSILFRSFVSSLSIKIDDGRIEKLQL